MVADETGVAVMVTSGGEVTDNLLGEDPSYLMMMKRQQVFLLDPLLAKLGSLR